MFLIILGQHEDCCSQRFNKGTLAMALQIVNSVFLTVPDWNGVSMLLGLDGVETEWPWFM